MTVCPYSLWAFLPLEQRRRLRGVFESRGGSFGDNRCSPPAERIAHLADKPRCRCLIEEVAA